MMKEVETQALANAAGSAARDLHGFLLELIDRYAGVARRRESGDPESTVTADRQAGAAPAVPRSLVLAEAAVRCQLLSATSGDRPLQIAVLGPTQAGKSTIVNVLLGCEAATVSPLAGFTVHPQGFWLTLRDTDATWAEELFPGRERVQANELSRDRLDTYALTRVVWRSAESATLPPCVVWDTPDFDSLAAHAYERNLLETTALADAYVLVLSKEKYSDLSAWQMLKLLEPLNRPLLICLNKMTPDAMEAITLSLRQRLGEFAGRWKQVEIVHFPYVESMGSAGIEAQADAAALRAQLGALTARAEADTGGVIDLIQSNWDAWLGPIRGEHVALNDWSNLVEAALKGLLEAYRRDYLDHPQRYDSFRRATAELLNLLEIPGIGGVLSGVRQVVSWPGRKLWAAGRSVFSRNSQGGSGSRVSSEERVLYDSIDEMLMRIQRDAARRGDARGEGFTVWRAVSRRLGDSNDDLRRRFQIAAGTHHELMAREIQIAAGQLYETLQKQPAVLAGLRTARLSADVASIALAIKMGGASLNDLVFAPAMFGLTSMLTEGALGTYVHGVAEDLKRRQFENVRVRLVDGVFRQELLDVQRSLPDEALFGVSAQRASEAQSALEELSRGAG